MELENEKTESVHDNENKENKNVDEFQEYIFNKNRQTQKQTTKRHEGVECHIINPLLTKLDRSI